MAVSKRTALRYSRDSEALSSTVILKRWGREEKEMGERKKDPYTNRKKS